MAGDRGIGNDPDAETVAAADKDLVAVGKTGLQGMARTVNIIRT
jgi:hypothetical protein